MLGTQAFHYCSFFLVAVYNPTDQPKLSQSKDFFVTVFSKLFYLKVKFVFKCLNEKNDWP
jgi:hypothetical protein